MSGLLVHAALDMEGKSELLFMDKPSIPCLEVEFEDHKFKRRIAGPCLSFAAVEQLHMALGAWMMDTLLRTGGNVKRG